MSYRNRVALLVLLIASGPALAHSSLPSENWCAHGRTVVVAHIYFVPEQIQNFANCEPVMACVVPPELSLGARSAVPIEDCSQVLNPEPTASCGVFDDDYSLVRGLTDSYCTQHEVQSTSMHVPDWGSVVANLVNPDPDLFYDAQLHHQFVIGQSVELMCLRCEDPGEPMQ